MGRRPVRSSVPTSPSRDAAPYHRPAGPSRICARRPDKCLDNVAEICYNVLMTTTPDLAPGDRCDWHHDRPAAWYAVDNYGGEVYACRQCFGAWVKPRHDIVSTTELIPQ